MAKQKRIGRQTKPAKAGTRVPLSLRVTAEMKANLEGAAEMKGRSLTQETEFRLEQSFERQGLLRDVLTIAMSGDWADFLEEHAAHLSALAPEYADVAQEVILSVIEMHADHLKAREKGRDLLNLTAAQKAKLGEVKNYAAFFRSTTAAMRDAAVEDLVATRKKRK
jgi:hypothetical protein